MFGKPSFFAVGIHPRPTDACLQTGYLHTGLCEASVGFPLTRNQETKMASSSYPMRKMEPLQLQPLLVNIATTVCCMFCLSKGVESAAGIRCMSKGHCAQNCFRLLNSHFFLPVRMQGVEALYVLRHAYERTRAIVSRDEVSWVPVSLTATAGKER